MALSEEDAGEKMQDEGDAMNWAGASVFLGLVTLGVVTFPFGLVILVPLAWFFAKEFKR